MKICHITTVHPKQDERIFFKECITLKKAGFDVSLIVAENSEDEILEGIPVLKVKKFNSRTGRIFRGSWKMFRRTLQTKCRVVHFHDPELMWVGVLFRLSGKKVIYDVHEDLPKQVLYKEWISAAWVRRFFSLAVLLSEKFCCLFFQGIVSVTEDIADKYNPRKTLLIRNFPLISLVEASRDLTSLRKREYVLVYAGGLTPHRGIREIIDAVGMLDGTAELWLLGDFSSAEYMDECRSREGWQYVQYFGYKRPDEVYSYVKAADAGLALLYPLKNYLKSLPVKAFEYMAFGKPMVMSDFPFWRQYFQDYSLFAPCDVPAEIADRIQMLMQNPVMAEEMGSRAKEKVLAEYSWEAESEKLIYFYRKLLPNADQGN